MFLVAHIRDEINRSVHAGSVNKGKSLEGFQNLRMLLWIKRQDIERLQKEITRSRDWRNIDMVKTVLKICEDH
ncbi:unnamed protein product [Tenebrio molitor]|nr:unnamed protein product [Tenebrio molitor]